MDISIILLFSVSFHSVPLLLCSVPRSRVSFRSLDTRLFITPQCLVIFLNISDRVSSRFGLSPIPKLGEHSYPVIPIIYFKSKNKIRSFVVLFFNFLIIIWDSSIKDSLVVSSLTSVTMAFFP